MWAVLKIDKKNLFFLKKDLEKTLGEEVQFYNPKILIEKFYQNKKISKRHGSPYIPIYHY